MIINYDSPGQLCNRIWSLVPSIAYGLEYKEKVLIINFSEYSTPFEDLNKNELVSFAKYDRIKRLIFSLKVRGYIQNGQSNIFSRLFGFNMVEGWSNRLGNAEMVQNQAEAIREIFQFNKNVTEDVDSQFSSSDDYNIVGVHIRRGDYRTWLDGIYYYTNEEYLSIMDQVALQLKATGKRTRFLLCSNENIDLSEFSDLDCFIISDSSGAKDLYALSKCNYIIGPPSSYSQWASFMGKAPVKYILSANEKIRLADFSPVISFNNFANGNVLDID